MLERNGWGIALNDVRLGKGNCLYRITQKMGLRPEEVIAIGDSNNEKKIVEDNYGIVAEQSYGMGEVGHRKWLPDSQRAL